MRQVRIKCGWLLVVAFVGLLGCKQHYQLAAIQTKPIPIKQPQVADLAMEAYLKPFRQKLDSTMNVQLGQADLALTKQAGENLLGNWCTNALLATYQEADLALLTNGGLRAPISKGIVTVRSVYELMPFDNKVVILSISVSQVYQLANMMAADRNVNLGGARVIARGGKADSVFVKGVYLPKAANQSFKLVTIDYLQQGGDKMSLLASSQVIKQNGRQADYFLRDLFLDYIKQETAAGRALTAQLEGRLIERK